MEFPIEKLGVIILAVLILVAIVIFVVVGVSGQTTTLNQTSQNIISNLTEAVESVR